MASMKSSLQNICGDCGASDPSWASINRGVLLCSDCCSVHRSLGRHVSLVKSLRQDSWSESLKNFINTMNSSHGANCVWEHSLINPQSLKGVRRKPFPKDAVHPAKSDFIRSKYVNLAFTLKPKLQKFDDECGNLETELSKQLCASVRSGNLETSLRLLAQGADPNYYNEEKGSTPLHVAAKSGQASQIELLVVYGANIMGTDHQGLTPIDVARNNNHFGMAERLVEALYEVTDRLGQFIGQKKPNHAMHEHFLVPQDGQIELTEQLKIARGKLQLIPNTVFEALVMDIYDEADRREMEAVWATTALHPEIGAVPFLPANPHLTATRNQGRQKLARLSSVEFSHLIRDVLFDAQRRENFALLQPLATSTKEDAAATTARESHCSDDEPLYDCVASDDEVTTVSPMQEVRPPENSKLLAGRSPPAATAATVEVENLKKVLMESFSEINELKTMVQQLSVENNHLKSRIEPAEVAKSTIGDSAAAAIEIRNQIDTDENDDGENGDEGEDAQPKKSKTKRPASMFEPRESHTYKANLTNENRSTTSMYQIAPKTGKHRTMMAPTREQLKPHTDRLTRCIQELWNEMQNASGNKTSLVSYSEKICDAVSELNDQFPTVVSDEPIKNALKSLQIGSASIRTECIGLQKAAHDENSANLIKYMQDVRNSAYNLAMATKILVTQFS